MAGVTTRATKGSPLSATEHDDNLETIIALHKSATEPSPTYACMLWADTATTLLKQRNTADSAWTTLGTLDTAGSFGGGSSDVADDTTPQLGGNLDMQAHSIEGVDATEIAILDGATVTTAELNILDGVTSTTAELNTLDGITSTVTELNYTDGVTSAIQTQLDAKLSSVADNSVTLAKMAGGTDGNLITYDASGDPAYVTTGTSGQILTSGGTGVAPTFQTAAGGGKVLQVVSTTKTDTFTTTTTGSWVDITGLSATITPSSTSSKVLVNINIKGGGVLALNVTEFRLVRGSTVINKGDPAGSRNQGFSGTISSDASDAPSTSTNYLDSPGLATALTYKIQLHSNNTSYINMSSADANNANTVRQTSDITLSEIGA